MSYEELVKTDDQRPVHFMGVAGAGMAALAELFVRRSIRVTGCDSGPTQEVLDDLARIGIDVSIGHSPSHIEGARAVVVTSAVAKDHPEILAANAAGTPVIRRAEALGAAVYGGKTIGVSGTHGKTTTTVMTTMALDSAGMNPTGIVGGRVSNWDGNLSLGGDEFYVVEADEYDRSFLALTPHVAIVTSVEADHLDIYKDIDDINRTFADFVKPAKAIVLCADDLGANNLPTPSSAEIFRYGIDSADARVQAIDIELEATSSKFSVIFDGELLGDVNLSVPGRYNIRNALAAICTGLFLGADFSKVAAGLASFKGVERRFQSIGEVGDVIIIDDYAHHPTELTATLEAAREGFPDRRIVAAFQPHLYSRTKDFAHDFAVSLALADSIFIADIYPAREAPIPGVSSKMIAKEIANIGAGGQLEWVGPRDEIADQLAQHVKEGDLVLTIGAGDITKSSRELLLKLKAAWER